MPTGVVKALVPTAIAATLLLQEFPVASLDTDGSLFTVVIYGISYSDAVSRIRQWMTLSQVGPVLVTDGETAEDLLDESLPRNVRHSPSRAARPVPRSHR